MADNNPENDQPEINDLDLSDDPIVKLGNPLLEIVLPDDEPTLFTALRYADFDMVEQQIREGVDLNCHKEGESYSLKGPHMSHRIKTTKYAALHVAVLHSPIKMISLLLDNGASINILDEQHRTPLHFAVVANRIPVINLLIERGCDVNVQSSSGRTPLLESVINGSYDIAKMFVNAGCDLDITDTKGTGVLHQLCFTQNPNVEMIARILRNKTKVIVIFLALSASACKKLNILPYQVYHSTYQAETWNIYAKGQPVPLIEGCTVDLTNLKGATPLMYATSLKSLTVVKYLVENGADINKRDNRGNTAANFIVDYKMASGQRQNVLLYLIHQGADLNCKDKMGLSMLEKALRNMALSTIKLLLIMDCPRNSDFIMEHSSIKQLCDAIPEFKMWLIHELYTPRSLMRLCRGTIRQSLSSNGLLKVLDLELPSQLQNFVLGRDILPQHMQSYR